LSQRKLGSCRLTISCHFVVDVLDKLHIVGIVVLDNLGIVVVVVVAADIDMLLHFGHLDNLQLVEELLDQMMTKKNNCL
jgi:hypothetical protein